MPLNLVKVIAPSILFVSFLTPVAQAQNITDYLNQINRYAQDQYPRMAEFSHTIEGQLLDQVDAYGLSRPSMNQSVGVTQFGDVSPKDWAYQALDDLVRRYDCLKGYPNGLFRGDRPLSRYEFAAGLNACMQQIERLIAETTADFVIRDDLEAIQRLMQDFEAELNSLSSRVDTLERRTTFLEDNAFSTTTKLVGEVTFAATQAFTNNDPSTLVTHTNLSDGTLGTSFVDNDAETVFGYRSTLQLHTSFSGEDLLILQMVAANLDDFAINEVGGVNSAETNQGFSSSNTNNGLFIDWVGYYVPLAEGMMYLTPLGGIWSDNVPTINPYFDDVYSSNEALSYFAVQNPIYRIGGGAGFIYHLDLGLPMLSVGYLAGQASNASRGLFSGDYAMLAQTTFDLSDEFQLGLTYVHGYHPSGFGQLFDIGAGSFSFVGSSLANNGFASVTNSYGLEAAWQPTDWLSISGFFAYTHVQTNHNVGTALLNDRMDVWTYGLGFAFPDLGQEGNLLGIFLGAQPYAAGNHDLAASSNGANRSVGGSGLFRNDNVPYHVEAFYKHQINDHISITPGLIWLSAPNQIEQSALVGAIRTVFQF